MIARRHRRFLLSMIAAALLGGAGFLAWLYHAAGLYGLNVLVQRGGSYWTAVAGDSPRLSPAMRLALQADVPAPSAAPPVWQDVGAGLEVAEMPVTADGREVDRLLLARLDPGRLRLIVRVAPAGNHDLQDWMHALGAVLVVNGSYYDQRGAPATPLLSEGALLGPDRYEARHAALVATDGEARIVELNGQDWRAAFASATDGFVSYPLLLARDGLRRPRADRRWLANRSFVAVDVAGRIVIGTTTDAFFSLDRLADFLRAAPLGLAVALNLDGGPVACQGIAAGGYRRDFCGSWETNTEGDALRLLRWPLWWRRFSLPIVLAAVPR